MICNFYDTLLPWLFWFCSEFRIFFLFLTRAGVHQESHPAPPTLTPSPPGLGVFIVFWCVLETPTRPRRFCFSDSSFLPVNFEMFPFRLGEGVGTLLVFIPCHFSWRRLGEKTLLATPPWGVVGGVADGCRGGWTYRAPHPHQLLFERADTIVRVVMGSSFFPCVFSLLFGPRRAFSTFPISTFPSNPH